MIFFSDANCELRDPDEGVGELVSRGVRDEEARATAQSDRAVAERAEPRSQIRLHTALARCAVVAPAADFDPLIPRLVQQQDVRAL